MTDFVKLAKAYSNEGYSVIPVGTNKVPTIKGWREFQKRVMTDEECELNFSKAYGMALICGGVNNITALDFDLKYDFSGDLIDRYKAKIPRSLLKKMFVQKTQSGGYHFVFSCPHILEGNQKLASRFTTADEKHRTYIEYFENPITKNKALKVASNDTSRVLIETRGDGGYILISPTKGYEKIYGKISEITEEEYHILMETAREFDEIRKVDKKDSRRNIHNDKWKITPFEDYNNKGDVVHLLESNGWSPIGGIYGKNIRFKRPGKSSPTSALFDTQTRVFNCFSTSTSLDNTKGYSPSSLFIHYECNEDVGEAYGKLVEMGYGVKK